MNNIDGFVIIESTAETIPSVLTNRDNSIIFKARLQDAEEANRNNRIYSYDALHNALTSPVITEKLENRTLYGEAGHPLSDDVQRQTYIDQTRISHLITKIEFNGNAIDGTIETAKTHVGADMRGLIRQGSKVAFSMRGLGNVVKKEGSYTRVCDPLLIITYDWVVFPSHPNAYMTKKLSESLDYQEYKKQSDEGHDKGMIIGFNMKEMLSYITDSSKKVKVMTESLGFTPNKDMSNVSINDKHNMISIKEGNETLKCFLETSLKKEIDNYFINF